MDSIRAVTILSRDPPYSNTLSLYPSISSPSFLPSFLLLLLPFFHPSSLTSFLPSWSHLPQPIATFFLLNCSFTTSSSFITASMANAQLPLHCSICPKKPDFSDVSHLLTHIASKGHLSHYYRIKVRSSHDQAARDSIETYDNWYVEWNVEKLMSERMHQKDRKKRSKARDQGTASSVLSRCMLTEQPS